MDLYAHPVNQAVLDCIIHLHCRQISFVEDDQPGNATDETSNHQHPGIPGGDIMRGNSQGTLRVVERLDLLHPGEVTGESAQYIHQVSQADDADSRTASSTAGIHE